MIFLFKLISRERGWKYLFNVDLSIQFKWAEPDEEGIVKYLCGDKQFNEERVRNGVKKLMKSRGNSTQGRLDSFFKVLPSTPNTSVKRKVSKHL